MTHSEQSAPSRCYRHPDTETRITCARCGKPICDRCMVDAAVGFHCPDCTREGARQTGQGQLPYGGYPSKNPMLTSYILIALNVLVWIAIRFTGSNASPIAGAVMLTPRGVCETADGGSYFPSVTSAAQCATVGAGATHWWSGVASGSWWQVITSAFAQIDLIHLALNMVSLLLLCPAIEKIAGRTRFLTIYLLSALAGSAMVMWFSAPAVSTLGASGALWGIMGSFLLFARKTGGNYKFILAIVAFNVLYTFGGPMFGQNISWQAHIGGLIGGMLVTQLLISGNRETRSTRWWPGVAVIAGLLVVAIAARAVLLAG